eukprot:4733464-Ditylum_brightwellii.AAC.1
MGCFQKQPASLPTEGSEDVSEEIELSFVECTTSTIQGATKSETGVMAWVVNTADLGGASEAPLPKIGTQTFNAEISDDVSELSASVGASEVSGGIGYSWSSAGISMSIPVAPKLQNCVTDDTFYEDGYDTNGDVGSFFDAVEEEEDMGVPLEEEALPSTEEMEVLVARAANP